MIRDYPNVNIYSRSKQNCFCIFTKLHIIMWYYTIRYTYFQAIALENEPITPKHPPNVREAVDKVTEKIREEIKMLYSKGTNSILRGKTDEELSRFSWSKGSDELKKYTPTFWQIHEKCAHNPRQTTSNVLKTEEAILPGLASAACKLISLYNKDMDSAQRLHALFNWEVALGNLLFAV